MHNFTLTRNEKARITLRNHEIAWRVEELMRKIDQHQGDKDYSSSLTNWRRELLDLRAEQCGAAVAKPPATLHTKKRSQLTRGEVEYAAMPRGLRSWK